jgi:hypothetical protein
VDVSNALVEVIVKSTPAFIAYDKNPCVPPGSSTLKKILSFAPIFVFATVTVPPTNISLPIKSVGKPPFIIILVPAVPNNKLDSTSTCAAARKFKVEPAVAEPIATSLAAAPVPILIVCPTASVLIKVAPLF